MFADDELLPLSALQHLVFCERRFALVHIERLWVDNAYTVEGSHAHERVDRGGLESRGDLRTVRALPLVSHELGLAGKADLLELRRVDRGEGSGVSVPGWSGAWRPVVVEYKRGTAKDTLPWAVQLCAQALCLEEMLGWSVREGALYSRTSRRREAVEFDHDLRVETRLAAARAHFLFAARATPLPRYARKCLGCSLFGACQPKAPRRSARVWLAAAVAGALADGGDTRDEET